MKSKSRGAGRPVFGRRDLINCLNNSVRRYRLTSYPLINTLARFIHLVLWMFSGDPAVIFHRLSLSLNSNRLTAAAVNGEQNQCGELQQYSTSPNDILLPRSGLADEGRSGSGRVGRLRADWRRLNHLADRCDIVALTLKGSRIIDVFFLVLNPRRSILNS